MAREAKSWSDIFLGGQVVALGACLLQNKPFDDDGDDDDDDDDGDENNCSSQDDNDR